MGFEDRRLVFGGAPPGTPWGTLGLITQRALAGHGYEVAIEPEASRGRCMGLVSRGELHFGATQALTVAWAYQGAHAYRAEGPMTRLRAIATIMHPVWLGIAVREETGITDLSQVRGRQYPLRVLGGVGEMFSPVWKHYGLSREMIESWGGRFLPALDRSLPVRTGEVDLIMENIYAAYTLEEQAFHEAAVLMNLRFLPMPHELIQRVIEEYGGEPGFIPYRLLRGVHQDTPSVSRPWQLVFGRDDMPDDFAYLLARAYDEGRRLFRETLLPYSYDSTEVARDHGIPLHPGAERYYRERGYI